MKKYPPLACLRYTVARKYIMFSVKNAHSMESLAEKNKLIPDRSNFPADRKMTNHSLVT